MTKLPPVDIHLLFLDIQTENDEGCAPLGTKIEVTKLIHRRTLILGDVGSGKTELTARILDDFLEYAKSDKDFSVIDMAPRIQVVKGMRVGGRVDEFVKLPESVRYLAPSEVRLPRLEGKTRGEVLSLALANRNAIDRLIDVFAASPSPMLFVNDLSIYLQAGSADRIRQCIALTDTFVGNAYYGTKLRNDHGSGISNREAKAVTSIRGLMDLVISL